MPLARGAGDEGVGCTEEAGDGGCGRCEVEALGGIAQDEVEVVREPGVTVEESEGGAALEDDEGECFCSAQGGEDGFLGVFLEDVVR